MTLVPMRALLDRAAEGGYGLAAFNVNSMVQVQAVMEAADATGSPVILQATTGARAFAGDLYLLHLVRAAAERYPHIPVAFHHDHANSPESCYSAIELGFTSVMMDGSLLAARKTPSDFEYNVRVTREVVRRAHAAGVTVEGELGTIGGIEDGHGANESRLTDPDQAVEFVRRTGVDALAVAIGTSHGAYKFDRPPDGSVLAMDRIVEIHRRLPDVHLVMHGSSSVPARLIESINGHGGALHTTFGLPVDEIQRGIRHGVRKINVDTDLRLAMLAGIRRSLAESPDDIDPRSYLGAARQAMREIAEERMLQFSLLPDREAGSKP
jgi:fructose-bisphosphate aldolase, class II